ncbi:GNAT family N-acetyltransferase [Catenulispora rubra]|uniref:GNAT family N-acetyltransferase n=1 Tax=Catenulispora rubra TaxID=280293 RepID=UPI0018922FD6|nr:GNAT family N-acetyltransferase [Catenulispora rubra]
MIDVRDERHLGRYTAYHGGRPVGCAEWILAGDTVVLPHMQVDAAYHDAGIGSLLMRRIAADAVDDGRAVLPLCPFSRTWSRRNAGSGAGSVVLPGELGVLHAALADSDPDLWTHARTRAPHGPPTS